MWLIGSREEQRREERRRYTEATVGQLQKSENGGEEEDQEGKEGIEKENRNREQGGTSCKLFWTNLRGKGKE